MPAFDNQTLEGWHHVAIINNNGTKILYVDGIKTDQLVESNSIYQCGIKFTMGGSLDRPNINATTIIIDNMRVYKYRAITADDVNSALSQQTSFPFNVFVVENGPECHSTDGTTEAVDEYNDERLIHIVTDRRDLGVGGSWNLCAHDPRCSSCSL